MAIAVYPGQGAQSVGMGKDLFENFQLVRHLFEEASDAVHVHFQKLLFEGPESELQLTANTQPALLLTSVAAYRVANEECGFHAVASAGHSVGEYAAMVNSGVLTLSQAIQAVRRRGEAMQEAVPIGRGGMVAAMGLTPPQAQTLCEWAQKQSGFTPIETANFNAPGQIVLSGSQDGLSWLTANFKAEDAGLAGVRVRLIPLKVSAPFHCSMMAPAEAIMRKVLEQMAFQNAQSPIVQNFTAQAETDSAKLRENLIRQISGPVRWIECVQKLKEFGHSIVEFGNGRVLSGLIQKIAPELKVKNVGATADIKELANGIGT